MSDEVHTTRTVMHVPAVMLEASTALSVGVGGTLALLSACEPVVAVVVGVRRRVGAGRA